MDIFMVTKPDGERLIYTRESKANRVASLYGVKYIKNPDQTATQGATWMQWR